MNSLFQLTEQLLKEEKQISLGGGKRGLDRQKRLGRLSVRERLSLLLDAPEDFLELGIFAGYKMYERWGPTPAAGVVTGIGTVEGRSCMIIANDATVKAGALFPQSVKKVLRAQRIAYHCRLPILYLVDSAGVFLPLQDEIFPDEDDFGRIFRNNAVLSAQGIPQYAAIMGNCIAGGGYLPVLCDKVLMTEGSGLYLAGPALVKAAIGQDVDPEELGGAQMHATLSGTVDFREKDDTACLQRLRTLVSLLPENTPFTPLEEQGGEELYEIVSGDGKTPYDMRRVLSCLVDQGSLEESKREFGKALITAYARIGGIPVGIVANQRKTTQSGQEEMEIGGVIYGECADKAARFVLECNQARLPLIFLQDVMGFMVGKESEQDGIIRRGAKLVNAVSNSIVPKISIILGNSFGAGHYALCGKAYDPHFLFAWPGARYAVMGPEQAAGTLLKVRQKIAEREGEKQSPEEEKHLYQEVLEDYVEQLDIRYAAARGWVDAIIPPHLTRAHVHAALTLSLRGKEQWNSTFHTGVIQT